MGNGRDGSASRNERSATLVLPEFMDCGRGKNGKDEEDGWFIVCGVLSSDAKNAFVLS